MYYIQIFAIWLPVQFFFPVLDTKYQLIYVNKNGQKRKKKKKKTCDCSLNGKTTKNKTTHDQYHNKNCQP